MTETVRRTYRLPTSWMRALANGPSVNPDGLTVARALGAQTREVASRGDGFALLPVGKRHGFYTTG